MAAVIVPIGRVILSEAWRLTAQTIFFGWRPYGDRFAAGQRSPDGYKHRARRQTEFMINIGPPFRQSG
jgi:hypothetical protein